MIEQIEKPKKWYQDSILFKLGVITIIILLLLIPSSWIQDLIIQREGYQQEMMSGVTEKWAGSQLVQGSVLVLPYKKTISQTGTNGKDITSEVIFNLYVLPEKLKIKADVKTEQFQNGVYDAIVYNSKVQLDGNFNTPNLNAFGIEPASVLYDKAHLIFSVSHLKGLKNSPAIKIEDKEYNAEPASGETNLLANRLQANFPLQSGQGFTFSYQLDLKGSNELNFLHTGKITDVEVNSDWKSPGFSGSNEPDARTLTEKGSDAKWHLLYYNRPYPQQWINNDTLLTNKQALSQAVVGVKLQLPIDQYRKILRTAKYSMLIILLTFISLFLTELIKKQNIHLFNYVLIGAAMVVYYTLLLSFSEQIGYTYAYLLSSASTIILIAVFTASLLKQRAIALLFTIILSVFYGFIYVIIQLEKLSLLFGSIALFIIVSMLMYFSRKINWDKN